MRYLRTPGKCASIVRSVAILLTGLLVSVHSPTAVSATVYLVDGSVVKGKLLQLVDGQDLTVDTEHMGDVVIEWNAIETIEGESRVNVELFSGERLAGNLTMNEGQPTLMPLDSESRVALDPENVYSLSEFKHGWGDGFDAHVDLGLNIVRGNNQVTQITYGAGVSYEANSFTSTLDTTLIVNEQTGAADTERFTFRGSHTQRLSRKWSAGAIYQFESDDLQQLIGRSLLAGVLNNRVVNNRTNRLELSGGLALNAEEFDGVDRSESIEGVLGAAYRLRSKSDVDFDLILYVLPSLTDSGRWRVQTDSTLSTDLIGDLEVKLTYYNRYDNRPPVAVRNFDYGLTLGLGYEF